jgi:hypothetical protein
MQEIIEGMDPAKARLAFAEVLPVLDAHTDIRRANTDMNKAAVVAAAVGRLVKQDAMRAVFATLPAARFDIQHVDRLESIALATWHALLCLRNAATLTTGAKIPENVADATALKHTMMKVLDYYLGHLPDVSKLLADIREGTGYVDLASDLARLSELYVTYAPILAVDTMRYKATDAEEAGRLSGAIHQVLGDGRHSDAHYWTDYVARAWSLLVITYEEVSAAGSWLFRHENGEALFPSLYAIGRRRRRDQGDDGAVGGPDDGAGGSDGAQGDALA